MAYTFDQIFAADPSNPERVASHGVITIFAPGDTSRAPLVITTVDGMAIQNPVTVNESGHGPAFIHETLDRVAWEGGGFSGFLTSYEGMKREAVAARQSAGVAANAATEAASNSTAPTAEAVEREIITEGTLARQAVELVANLASAPKLDKAEAADTFAVKPDNGERAVGKGELALNVKDFGAKGDGVTDDSDALRAAVEACNFTRTLFFPPGNYRVTRDFGNFLACSSDGDGKIIWGADTFSVTPTRGNVNTIYVSMDGLDTNTGLSAASPVGTLYRVGSHLNRLGSRAADGQWKVKLLHTPGRPYPGFTFGSLNKFTAPLTFEGETKADGTPLTLFRYGGPGASQFGLRFDPSIFNNIRVLNIVFDGYSVGFNGYGLLMKGGGTLTAENCLAERCDIGFAAIQNVIYSFQRCTSNNNTTDGFRAQYNSSGIFLSSTAKNNSSAGIYISRGAVSHVDYCALEGNSQGVKADQNSRAGLIGNDFRRNDVAIYAMGGAEYDLQDDISPNLFNSQTTNANVVNLKHTGSARMARQHAGQNTGSETKIHSQYIATVTHTGTAGETMLFGTPSGWHIRPNFFDNPTKRARVVIWGRATGAGGAKKIILRSTNIEGENNVLLASHSITASSTTKRFRLEAYVVPQDHRVLMGYGSMLTEGEFPSFSSSNVAGFGQLGLRFRVYGDLAVASDSIIIDGYEAYVMG